MSVRIVCPSCSAQLNIRDEHAGRPVKCPKCSYVIPASQAHSPAAPEGAALPPAPAPTAGPPPLPQPPPPMNLEDAPPAPGRPTAKPAETRPQPRGRDEDDEKARPRKRSRRRDNDDDDDYDQDRPRRRPPQKKSSAPTVLLVLGILLLGCCGAGGYGIYYGIQKVREAAEDLRRRQENNNWLASRSGYEQMKLNSFRSDVERILGPGRPATMENVTNAFRPGSFKIAEWEPRVAEGRVFYWRNGEDYILACFYPDADGKLQAKAWEPESRNPTAISGDPDDKKYLRLYSDGNGGGAPGGPAANVTAEQLAREYENAATADAKYKEKAILVDGTLNDITMRATDVVVILEGLPAAPGKPIGTKVFCVFETANSRDVWRLSRGQKVKIRGTGAGTFASFINVINCRLESQEADPSAQLQTSVFLNEFGKDAQAADEKYKDKALTLQAAVVESKDDAALILVGPFKKGSMIKIKANWSPDAKKQLENLKAGSRVTVKGEYSNFSDGTIYLNRCWLAP